MNVGVLLDHLQDALGHGLAPYLPIFVSDTTGRQGFAGDVVVTPAGARGLGAFRIVPRETRENGQDRSLDLETLRDIADRTDPSMTVLVADEHGVEGEAEFIELAPWGIASDCMACVRVLQTAAQCDVRLDYNLSDLAPFESTSPRHDQ